MYQIYKKGETKKQEFFHIEDVYTYVRRSNGQRCSRHKPPFQFIISENGLDILDKLLAPNIIDKRIIESKNISTKFDNVDYAEWED